MATTKSKAPEFNPSVLEDLGYAAGASIDGHNGLVRGVKAARDPEEIAEREADDQLRIDAIKAHQRAKRAARRAA